jgi:hypothetical protein
MSGAVVREKNNAAHLLLSEEIQERRRRFRPREADNEELTDLFR